MKKKKKKPTQQQMEQLHEGARKAREAVSKMSTAERKILLDKAMARIEGFHPRMVKFRNSKGDIIHIPCTHTIEDLLGMGIKEIRLERKGSFLPDGWYKNNFPPEHKTTKTHRKAK
jgi:hypothetical protein